MSKPPATMLGLVHFASHFMKYCKKQMDEALTPELRATLDPQMEWAEIWKRCVGSPYDRKNPLDWSKSSKTLTPFGTKLVHLRETISTTVWVHRFVQKELRRLDKGKEEEVPVSSDE